MAFPIAEYKKVSSCHTPAQSHAPHVPNKANIFTPCHRQRQIVNTRVIYFFMKERRIITVHGIRSKAIKIAAQDRKVALDRKRDWLERFQA